MRAPESSRDVQAVENAARAWLALRCLMGDAWTMPAAGVRRCMDALFEGGWAAWWAGSSVAVPGRPE